MLFYIISIIIIASALLAIFSRSALNAALWLVGCLIVQAVLFATMNAHLVAILQVLIYAGAVMVLMVFVVMMLNLSPEGLKWRAITGGRLIIASGAVYLAAVLGIVAYSMFQCSNVPMFNVSGTVENVGELLITKYAVPFELLGILLLVAVVGAVVMSRRDA